VAGVGQPRQLLDRPRDSLEPQHGPTRERQEFHDAAAGIGTFGWARDFFGWT
jgi:hypothetical protein